MVVNSGFGVQLRANANEGQQLLQVVDLERDSRAWWSCRTCISLRRRAPRSAPLFGRKPNRSGGWALYVSGGFENRIWRLTIHSRALPARSPRRTDSRTDLLKADAIELAGMAPGSADRHVQPRARAALPNGSRHQLGRA